MDRSFGTLARMDARARAYRDVFTAVPKLRSIQASARATDVQTVHE